jgi:hypothetical protein
MALPLVEMLSALGGAKISEKSRTHLAFFAIKRNE